MKILNLYAGIGGNRKLWGNEHDVTAIEYNQEIANIYQDFFPNDVVLVEDAHEYLAKHWKEFDFIWSSPPCQSHSKMRMLASKRGDYDAVMPDMRLWAEIVFLQNFTNNTQIRFVVENVVSYYNPIIKPTQKLDRHHFWSNFIIDQKKFSKPKVKHNQVTGKTERYGISIDGISTKHRKDQIIRNCVNPLLGKYILDCAMGVQFDNSEQRDISEFI